ncbi:hypothetical protein [Anaerosinus massiliensis]|uniref:hypothetical protein n=1 Tax=Massilibacillus massiliensis TaxID=1806837 RepID=UPI0018FECE1C|nr:hypothetical protein [Massilibacillus massiliensis]
MDKYVVVDSNSDVVLICDFPKELEFVLRIKDKNKITYINKNKYKDKGNSEV